eukprot:TRINITY_DN8208_c0_g1_i2.p1 TRINITY_DN8208_c0_g1~~TRINITY_DN8208_c0_g1_i2.p1  ORF type:complete len:345 (+),score=75.36 TRINITY_DN8208_c0_g1_i2:146-1180(+)
MAEAPLSCGNCQHCSQLQVLGYVLTSAAGPKFYCAACVDRYGDEVDDMEESPVNESSAVQRHQPPAQLSMVPAGMLQLDRMIVWSTGGSSEVVNVVADPEHNYFMGHGAERAWPASIVLAQFLMTRPVNDLFVVELGAGVGLPGIVMARRGARVLLTDLPWVVPLCEYNIEANLGMEGCRMNVAAAPLPWGCLDSAAAVATQGTPDMTIGADIIYRKEDLDALFATLRALRSREVILAVVDRENILADFDEKVKSWGWRAKPFGLADGRVMVLQLLNEFDIAAQPPLLQTPNPLAATCARQVVQWLPEQMPEAGPAAGQPCSTADKRRPQPAPVIPTWCVSGGA